MVLTSTIISGILAAFLVFLIPGAVLSSALAIGVPVNVVALLVLWIVTILVSVGIREFLIDLKAREALKENSVVTLWIMSFGFGIFVAHQLITLISEI
ncbi:hypothetical protein DEJ39_08685 [Bacteroidetes bacterium SCGC AAA795-G10]|nr:hypothetical protein DEJ39_08685 [Bacteroidetes bacterium SCGC AAA795-G10]